VVDSIKEIVSSAETRIADAKVDDNPFGFDKKVISNRTKAGEVE
jgi:hypothetical protein